MCVTRWRAVEMKRQGWLLLSVGTRHAVSTHPPPATQCSNTHYTPHLQSAFQRLPSRAEVVVIKGKDDSCCCCQIFRYTSNHETGIFTHPIDNPEEIERDSTSAESVCRLPVCLHEPRSP
uniref:Putative secreted protein n=1 Tax=Anopheles darlingi TaxID=43151 RepID=A0A2M4DLY8_ANODA